MMNLEKAWALLSEYTKNESLIKHATAVGECMKFYAIKNNLSEKDIERWQIAGILHDFDYEMYPNPTPPEGHPFKGNEILLGLGVDSEICEAIMGHATYTGVARVTQMAKTLFAVDELSGLITAAVYVRPDKSIHNLEVASVKKKIKDKAFARGCNREDIRLGAEELGIDMDEHISNIINALKSVSTKLFG